MIMNNRSAHAQLDRLGVVVELRQAEAEQRILERGRQACARWYFERYALRFNVEAQANKVRARVKKVSR